VIAFCGDGVADVFVNPFGLDGDVEEELFLALRSGRGRIGELEVTERPCHEAEGDLLSVHPIGSRVGRVVLRPIFDQSPKGFGIFFITSSNIGTDESVDKGEAIWFPDKLNITMSLRVFEKQSPVIRRLLRQKPRAPRSDIFIRRDKEEKCEGMDNVN